MSSPDETTTADGPGDILSVGVSTASRQVLDQMEQAGHIGNAIDGFRLGIAVAIAFGRDPRPSAANERRTMFNSGTLDPDSAIRQAIAEMYPVARRWPTRAAEDLAEQGLEVLGTCFVGDDLSFSELIGRVQSANDPAS